jgi:HEAT repeat protein
MLSPQNYSSPVSGLIQLGDPDDIPDLAYSQMGFTADHIADLSRMATDPALCNSGTDLEYWAPIHAWRALGLFPTPQSVTPLIAALAQLSDDPDWLEWISEDLTMVVGRMGGLAIPGLSELIADVQQTAWARENAIRAMSEIYAQHGETRSAGIAALTADFQAVESAAVMEQAYQAGRVDEEFMGDWDDVRVYLGLGRKPQ